MKISSIFQVALATLCALVFIGNASAASSKGLVQRMAAQQNISETAAKEQISSVFKAITKELAEGQEIGITSFGRFYVQQRTARKGRNPGTGESIDIPAKRYPRFSSSDKLKEILN